MIKREHYLKVVAAAVKRSAITAILGPRQCGKTTLAREFTRNRKAHHFDLESPPDRARLQNAELALGPLEGTIVIDEVQVMPELFPVLRVLVDNPSCKAKYLILGSASPYIVRNVSESLAGRVEFVNMSNFQLKSSE